MHILYYTFMHIYTPSHTLVCKQDSVCLGIGMSVPINFKCRTTEEANSIFHTPVSSRLQAHMAACLLSAFIRKSPARSRKKNSHCCNKMSLSFVSCTFQNNTINAKFIEGSVLKKNTTCCQDYIVIFCSFKGPSCCDCHMPLAIEMCFSCFSSH